MTLQVLKVSSIIDTSSANISTDFFQPALAKSVSYDRGVGYFSSGWLSINAQGLVQFASNEGIARWVTSPVLSADDFDALRAGDLARRDKRLKAILSRNVHDLKQSLETDTLSALAWMIADGILTFKLALPTNKLSGDFHDKFGIFADKDGNQLAFNGSYNESIQGTYNSETISIFPSWQHEVLLPYLYALEDRFNKLWNNQDANVRVYDLPESIKADILKLRTQDRPYPMPSWIKALEVHEQNSQYSVGGPATPEHIELRDYQKEAIKAWFDNNCQGLYEMATGTGKTITALATATRLFERERRLALVVSVPYQHLVDQWRNEMSSFGFLPILAYQSKSSWLNDLNREVMAFNRGYRPIMCVITTHTTFNSEHFQAAIAQIDESALLIADEAHHLGSFRSRQNYPHHINCRLALSATPDRWFDAAGTMALRDYFGRTVFQFTLEQAIGVSLTPYDYYPHLVELTEDELDEYHQLSIKIARLAHRDDDDRREAYEMLLIKRARLLNNAANKLVVLGDLIDEQRRIQHALFYCAPGQIDAVLRLLGLEKGLRIHRFTAQEPNAERAKLLGRFARGRLDGLAAMKCLDEGVDVPSTRTAYFLASSGNPREFIQRRGRILRQAEGKQFAIIHDLIAVPPVSGRSSTTYNSERAILRRELGRFYEFANTARNKHEALDVIWELAGHYQLRDFG